MVIDPVARRVDGESVRIAKDVLCAGATTKICLPEGPEEVERALARRGRRRIVVIGDDLALLRVVGLLHRQRDLPGASLAVVPVGPSAAVSLVRALGVPTGAVAAARAVLDGSERRLDLLVDDSGGVVLGGLRIPSGGGWGGAFGPYEAEDASPADDGHPHHLPYVPEAAPSGDSRTSGPDASDTSDISVMGGGAGTGGESAAGRPGTDGSRANGDRGDRHDRRDGPGAAPAPSDGRHQPWWTPAARTARTALTTLLTAPTAARRRPAPPPPQRLRVEADGVLLADLDRPVERVTVSASAADGLADVVVHHRLADDGIRARARAVTVSGPDFHYRADAVVGGPVRTRTWTVLPDAFRLTLPRQQEQD
ncbi:hypothetical protein AB0I22_00090 [Streptomyces sp. NPDC050610]|uniref:hypothetical protein n=1 Tax=Streptomyces sp. NPDC050610 TaxID=3157097 RepID=UPI0034217635